MHLLGEVYGLNLPRPEAVGLEAHDKKGRGRRGDDEVDHRKPNAESDCKEV